MFSTRQHRTLTRTVLLALGLFVAGCSGGGDYDLSQSALPEPESFPVHGVDVSYWQGDINWMQLRAAGTAFAFIKATEGGDWADPKFRENYVAAGAAGIPRSGYHFYYFCRPVEDQISWFIQNVPIDLASLPPVLDMEWNAHSKTCQLRPPKEQVVQDMTKWLQAIERHYGKRPIIYTSVDFHEERLVGEFEDYPIWVRSVAGHPSTRYGDRVWTFWQYTGTGELPGVEGDIDRNVFVGDRRDWKNFVDGTFEVAKR